MENLGISIAVLYCTGRSEGGSNKNSLGRERAKLGFSSVEPLRERANRARGLAFTDLNRLLKKGVIRHSERSEESLCGRKVKKKRDSSLRGLRSE